MADQFQTETLSSYIFSQQDLTVKGVISNEPKQISLATTSSKGTFYPYGRKANFSTIINQERENSGSLINVNDSLFLLTDYFRDKNHRGVGSRTTLLYNSIFSDSEEYYDSYHPSPIDIIATNGTTICKESDKVIDLKDSRFVNDGAVTPNEIEDVGIPIMLAERGLVNEAIWDAWAPDIDVIDTEWLENPFPYQTKYKDLKRTFSKVGYAPNFVPVEKEIAVGTGEVVTTVGGQEFSRKISSLYYFTYPNLLKRYPTNRYIKLRELQDDLKGAVEFDGIYAHPLNSPEERVNDIGILAYGDGAVCAAGIYNAVLDVSRSAAIAQVRFSSGHYERNELTGSSTAHVRFGDSPDKWTSVPIVTGAVNNLVSACDYSRNDSTSIPEPRFGCWFFCEYDGGSTTYIHTASYAFTTSSVVHELGYFVSDCANETLKNQGDFVTCGFGNVDVFNWQGVHQGNQPFASQNLVAITYCSGTNIDSFAMVGTNGGNPTLYVSDTNDPTTWFTLNLTTITGITATNQVRDISFSRTNSVTGTSNDACIITMDQAVLYLQESGASRSTLTNAANWQVMSDLPAMVGGSNISYTKVCRLKYVEDNAVNLDNNYRFLVVGINSTIEFYRFYFVGGDKNSPNVIENINTTNLPKGNFFDISDYNLLNEHLYWAGFRENEGEILVSNTTLKSISAGTPHIVCLADEEPVSYSKGLSGSIISDVVVLGTTKTGNVNGSKITKPNYYDLLTMFYGFGDGFVLHGFGTGADYTDYRTTIDTPAVASIRETTAFGETRLDYEKIIGPQPKGFRYGIKNARTEASKCIFRRDRYGQPRDMLEQRQVSKFVLGNQSGETLTITESPVKVSFVSGSTAFEKAKIYLTASLATSFNPKDSGIYDQEYRSGLPFFDDQNGLDSGGI